MEIGEVIRKCRTKKNITQEEMAAALHVTPQAISRWETGISYPDITMLPLLASYLKVSTDKLLGYENQEIPIEQEILNQSQVDSIFDYIPGCRGTGRRILVVDDSEFMRNILEDILTRSGDHRVMQAADGAECLKLLQTQQPDFCLLDIMMPGMDGLETLERIREAHPQLRVIMLSARSTPQNVIRALELGAVGFVAKPFTPASILERIE